MLVSTLPRDFGCSSQACHGPPCSDYSSWEPSGLFQMGSRHRPGDLMTLLWGHIAPQTPHSWSFSARKVSIWAHSPHLCHSMSRFARSYLSVWGCQCLLGSVPRRCIHGAWLTSLKSHQNSSPCSDSSSLVCHLWWIFCFECDLNFPTHFRSITNPSQHPCTTSHCQSFAC
jgi:hypothetical protein